MAYIVSFNRTSYDDTLLEEIHLVSFVMTTSKKLVMLCLTLWPLFYLTYVILVFWDLPLVAMTQLPLIVIIAYFITIVILLILITVYSFHLYKNFQVDDQSKLIWFVGFIFAGAFVMIFYWRKYIW